MNIASQGEQREISERRKAAFKRAKWHSRNVVFMRRFFPIVAILMLGVYFYDSEISFETEDLKASVEKIEIGKEGLKMINPRLEGHDQKTGSYVVTADYATQKPTNTDIVYLHVIEGSLTHPQNGEVELNADKGVFNNKKEVLDLNGNIVVKAQNGMIGRLQSAKIEFKKQHITSNKPVYMEMHSGHVRAQKMTIDGIGKTITFSGNVKVKLIKKPQQKLSTTAKE